MVAFRRKLPACIILKEDSDNGVALIAGIVGILSTSEVAGMTSTT